MKLNKILLLLFICEFVLSGCKGQGESVALTKALPEAKTTIEKGAAYLLYGDFGTLTFDGLNRMTQPWRVSNAAYLYSVNERNLAQNKQKLRSKMESFGFIYPDQIVNVPENIRLSYDSEVPVGIVEGVIASPGLAVSGASIGCAACHSGRVYDSSGFATNQAWLGIPNTSINLEAYTNYVYENLDSVTKKGENWRAFVAHYANVYPEVDFAEVNTLKLISPKMRKDIRKFANSNRRLAPYTVGSPGTSNGLGATKEQLGLLNKYHFYENEMSLVSIPVLADRALRSSILIDGAYSLKGEKAFYEIDSTSKSYNDEKGMHLLGLSKITATFVVPVMGGTDNQVIAALPQFEKVIQFIEHIRPPKFPGVVNFKLAEQGQKLFDNRCSKCHGSYTGELDNLRLVKYPNKLIPIDRIGTDPVRINMATKDVFDAFLKTRIGEIIDAAPTNGYVAPILTGVWISAPYLHNGSVPSLWDLLTPEDRPEKFYVGGHHLDYVKMGVDYPQGYVPFSTPYLYDTRKYGQSNAGHVKQVEGLAIGDKMALIEFLKLL
jgi:hypothetical protein